MTDRPKIRLDLSELTLRELDRASTALGEPLGEAMTGMPQFRAMAAVAFVVKQRTDPDYTYDQALDLTMADFEWVQPDPERSPADTSAPLSSGESGASIRSVS